MPVVPVLPGHDSGQFCRVKPLAAMPTWTRRHGCCADQTLGGPADRIDQRHAGGLPRGQHLLANQLVERFSFKLVAARVVDFPRSVAGITESATRAAVDHRHEATTASATNQARQERRSFARCLFALVTSKFTP